MTMTNLRTDTYSYTKNILITKYCFAGCNVHFFIVNAKQQDAQIYNFSPFLVNQQYYAVY